MDFFGAQDRARRRTWYLGAWFGAAVVALVVMTNLLIGAAYAWFSIPGGILGLDPIELARQLPLRYWLTISSGVIAVIGLASLYKYTQLRGGGRAVAEALGGRPIAPATEDPAEQRLLNVVAEMAIAAGLPVPPVYVIPEPGINAFAAGLEFGDAVIGVNSGTLAHLTRDELQGVIGHEFSHILNGDSRLNVRLLALLHGILFIGTVGRVLLQGSRRGRSSGRRASSGTAPILMLGIGLTLIGYAGTFFGRLIQAAVCRQREYLADAAAVQFTRQPAGIAGALKKIGGLAAGSRVRSAAAEEASHLFFGPVRSGWFNRLTGTHPPLPDRIRAIEPRWDGQFTPVLESDPAPRRAADPRAPRLAPDSVPPAASPTVDSVVAAVGRVDEAALGEAARLLAQLPSALETATREPWAAQALLFALVLGDHAQDNPARELLGTRVTDQTLAREALRLTDLTAALEARERLTLVELAVPALKTMSARQFQYFAATIVDLMRADQRIDLHEWLLHRLLVRALERDFASKPRPRTRPRGLAELADAVAELLSALVREDAPSAAARTAVTQALTSIGITSDTAFRDAPDRDFQRLNRALTALQALPPLQKPRLLKACAAATLHDRSPSIRQTALLRGVAAALDCPLPASLHGAR